MRWQHSTGSAAALLLLIAAATAHGLRAEQPEPARRVGWRIIELTTGRTLEAEDAELLSRAVLPGSLMQLPAVIALLESGAITPATRIDCPGAIVVNGRRVVCQHPRRNHPLGAVEALALSCNVFFARAGERLRRDAFNDVLASLGWPVMPASRVVGIAASGIEGTPVRPGDLVGAWRQVLADPPGVSMRSPTRRVVWDGLAAAAHDGAAAAFHSRGVAALAETATSVTSDGRSLGLVLSAWPAPRPTRAAIVLVEGAGGPDAAVLAAALARGERPAVPASPSARGAAAGPPRRLIPPPPAPAAPAAPSPSLVPRESDGVVSIRVGTPRADGTYAVRSLPLEDYVARVLAGEAAPRTPTAALEALAITARTFAFANHRRHARDGFDLCDTTHCQVLRDAYAATLAAAEATTGQVLAWHGAPASVFYTAGCGGRTERPSAVWRGAADPPYLPSRRDRGCGGDPKWVSEIPQRDLQRALASAGYRGALRKLKIRDRVDSGRVGVLTLEGLTPDRISGQDFRMAIGRTLGWQVVKSTAFELSQHHSVYTLKGHGYGHGVGLCVIGSMRRAADGESRASLLQTYFPGLEVADYRTLRLPPAPVIPTFDQPPPLAAGQVTR